MGSLTYNPAPGEPQVTEFRGVRLEAGKSVNVKDPRMLAKLDGHPQFEVQMDDKEREAAQGQGPNPLAGAVFTSGVPVHRPYYTTGGGAAAIDGDNPEAVGGLTAPILPPSRANAAGGGINGPTLGDLPTPEQVKAYYGTNNPLDSQEPGAPRAPSELKGEVQQVQAERQQQEEQAQAPARRGPGRPPRRPEPASDE